MINEAKIRKIQDKLKAAVLKIESEENVKIDFGSISYKEKGQESLIGIFDTFVHKEEIVNVPRYHRRENYRGIKDGK
jgi:hypothetical protein